MEVTLFNSMPTQSAEIEQEYNDVLKANDYTPEELPMYQYIEEVVESEFTNLKEMLQSISLNNNIIIIANLGFWHGRKTGYKRLDNNLSSILSFYNCDDIHLYADTKLKQIKANAHHHDGTHYLEYRVYRDTITDKQKDIFEQLIYNDELNTSIKNKYTQSIYKNVKQLIGF